MKTLMNRSVLSSRLKAAMQYLCGPWACLAVFLSSGQIVFANGDHQINSAMAMDQSIHETLSQIEQLRINSGPHDPAIAGQYLVLGAVLQEAERHRQAIENLNKALLIQKINFGLYDFRQVDILSAINRSYLALGDWENINNVYSHIEWIYKRNYEEFDPRWLPFLKELYQWHIQAQYLNTGQYYEEHEIQAEALHDQGERIFESHLEQGSGKESGRGFDCYWNEKHADDACSIIEE